MTKRLIARCKDCGKKVVIDYPTAGLCRTCYQKKGNKKWKMV